MNEKALTGYPSIDRPWLKHYSEEALGRRLPACSMYDYLVSCNRDNLSTTAISYFGKKYSYGQLISRIDSTADKLRGIGVKAGDEVMLMMLNIPEAMFILYALNKIGAVSDWIYFTKDTGKIISELSCSDAKWLITLDLPDLDYKLLSEKVKKLITVPLYASMPVYLKAAMKLKSKKQSPAAGVLTWDKLMRSEGLSSRKSAYVPDTPAVIVHTGGTTGVPKGVMLSNENLNSVAFQASCNEMALDRGKRVLHTIPPFVAFGVSLGTHLTLCNGMTVFITPDPDQTKGGELLRKYSPYAVLAGPAFVEGMLSDGKLKSKHVSPLGILLVGGESLTPAREQYANDFLKSHGSSAQLQSGYGMTESAAAATVSMNKGRTRLGSLGLPNSHTLISVFDPDTGKECRIGEQGEICISGGTVMLGYYKNPQETENIIKEHDGHRWLHTGDIGYMDEDGFVFFCGRIKRLYVIKSKADGSQYKVFPAVIESLIDRIDGVSASCVVCVKDSEWINRVIAYVQLEKGVSGSEEIYSEIMRQCKAELPSYDVPSEIRFIPQLPLTTLNKKDFRRLEQMAAEQ